MSSEESPEMEGSAHEVKAEVDTTKEENEDILAETATAARLKEDLDVSYGDKPGEVTRGRLLARYFSRFSRYNPHYQAHQKYKKALESGVTEVDVLENNPKPPSLDAAWAFFEHVTLPRHFIKETQTRGFSRDSLPKAEPGETNEKTALYGYFGTPGKDLADFGVGVGLYFWTLKVLCIIILITGCINIPVLMHFASDNYTSDRQAGLSYPLKGSAICTDQTWVACPDCTEDDWDTFPTTKDRFAQTADEKLTFILVNDCSVGFNEGLFPFISLVFLGVAIYVMDIFAEKAEVGFDEAQQTASDYSVEVKNPPKTANDPDEWKDFFESISNSHVTIVTVALDNEHLLKILAKRRTLVLSLEMMVRPGYEFDKHNLDDAVENALPLPTMKKLLCSSDAKGIHTKISILDAKIEEMSKQQYNVSHVFVTFETEEAQRKALKALSVKRLDVWKKSSRSLAERLLFRGNILLDVAEPVEPSSVRWNDLDELPTTRTIQLIVTTFLTLLFIAGGAFSITYAFEYSAAVGAIVIKVCNAITPQVCIFINSFESHVSEGSKEASLYVKMTIFRWINTAVITSFISSFSETLSPDKGSLINAIYAIHLAELVFGPVLSIMDIGGNLKRHVLGPRAPDQRRMTLFFTGTVYSIAERYTRTWAPAPFIGTQISELSRNIFFPITILVYAVVGTYMFGSFPFDNACSTDTVVPSDYEGIHTIFDLDNESYNITIAADDNVAYYCHQDLFRQNPVVFPAVPSFIEDSANWMTSGQKDISSIYGWSSVGALVESGKPTRQPFSEVEEIFAYIPQVKLAGYAFPLIACDVSGIKEGLIGWKDQHNSYDFYNLMLDVPALAKVKTRDAFGDDDDKYEELPIFSTIKDYDPPEYFDENREYEA
eukprot:scaffold788_cov56-Attheya_sp.AAC.4